MRISRVAKAVTVGIGAVVSVLTVAFADDLFDMNDTAVLITTLIEQATTVFMVWRVPNKDA